VKAWVWLLLVALLLAMGAVYLAGRAPTTYVLARECERYQEQRRKTDKRLRRDLARVSLGRPGLMHGPLEARMRLMEFLREHRRIEIRGWEVLMIPAGAHRPDPEDFLLAGTFHPARPTDHRDVQGEMTVWMAPRGVLARLLYRLRLTP